MNNTELLRQWREDRNINQSNTMVYVENVIEELLEIFNEDKDAIESDKDFIMDMIFDGLEPMSDNATIDAINDIAVFSTNEVETMGYNFDKTLNETIKEISSRVQDPIQKLDWEENGASGKWNKNRQQSKNSLYVAQYEKTKL